jgi:hypothetical protein
MIVQLDNFWPSTHEAIVRLDKKSFFGFELACISSEPFFSASSTMSIIVDFMHCDHLRTYPEGKILLQLFSIFKTPQFHASNQSLTCVRFLCG